MDKENQLLLGENRRYCRDIKDLELAIQAESITKQELESAKLELEDQLDKTTKKVTILEKSEQDSIKKIERLTGLNEELRDLINQEREASNEELLRLEKQSDLKIK